MKTWREDFHQKGRIERHLQDALSWRIYTDTEVSLLMSRSLKVTQYMHQTTRKLYSIWLSVPKVLYR